jgi:hypothetical protein
MNPQNNFFTLPVSTRDGRFVARYSEKGLAELNFPKVGTPRCGVRTAQRAVPTKAASMSSSAIRLTSAFR